MTITNEIKAKVFSGYLPYYIGTPGSLALLTIIGNLIEGKESRYRLSSLKPLSAITDEDAIEVAKMLSFHSEHCVIERRESELWVFCDEYFKVVIGTLKYGLTSKSIDGEPSATNANYTEINSFSESETLMCNDFLRLKGYDLPHYLLGGKTLHEAGLAIYETAE